MENKDLEKLHSEMLDYLKYSLDSYLKKAMVYEIYYHYENDILCNDNQEMKDTKFTLKDLQEIADRMVNSYYLNEELNDTIQDFTRDYIEEHK